MATVQAEYRLGDILANAITHGVGAVFALAGAAYLIVAAPRSPVPLRAGANEVLLYFFVFLYLAAAGGGAWSFDFMIRKWRGGTSAI